MKKVLLSEEEIHQYLKHFKGWAYVSERRSLHKTFQFKNFVCAFGVMTQIAIWAEKLDHHPDWSNVYGKVEIWLNTHDLGGVSGLDLALLEKIEECVGFQCNLEAYKI